MDSTNQMSYSVLMSVYYKENADYLQTAMESMWNQTVPTDDFILLCDGPLNSKLDLVIQKMESAHPGVLHVVRLQENRGLGNALNIGLKYCKHELIARMDSDDISRPDRCEKQIAIFQKHPEFSICSGFVEEFIAAKSNVYSLRTLPETQKDILVFAKRRNPFNHPCVMFRKSAVEEAGGYQYFYLLEDYFLWIRMLKNGCIGYNIQQPLLWMRGGLDMYKRRAGWKYVKSQISFFQYMKKNRFISSLDLYINCAARILSSLLPGLVREKVYKTFLRNT